MKWRIRISYVTLFLKYVFAVIYKNIFCGFGFIFNFSNLLKKVSYPIFESEVVCLIRYRIRSGSIKLRSLIQ